MNKYARFDEIPSMTLKDIKETKRYGWTEGQHENSIYKSHKESQRDITLIELTPSPNLFAISIFPVYMNVYARFDEILSLSYVGNSVDAYTQVSKNYKGK